MALKNSYIPVGNDERDFLEFMQRGDDFFKIELLRPAKSWYEKALAKNIDIEKVKLKIAECDRLLAYENKVIAFLGAIGLLVVLAYILIPT